MTTAVIGTGRIGIGQRPPARLRRGDPAALEPGFLRDPWNPYLPLLPFALYVVLCWAAICGDAWAVPVAVLPASLAVQSHVGIAARPCHGRGNGP
jgi:hypothetical protein